MFIGIGLAITAGKGGGYLPWDGATKFTASKGINEPPLGFDAFQPWSGNPNRWPNWMTTTRWNSLLQQTTVDHIRICIDPTPLLRATADATVTATYIAMIKAAIDDVLAHGLKAIVDMHVASADATYSVPQLIADYPAGPTWPKVQQVWRAVAVLCNRYSTAQVAFEVWNEAFSDVPANTAALKASYTAMLPALVTYLRGQVGLRTTFLLHPWNGQYDTATNPTFAASQFGQNCGYVFHMYTPGIFTHQGQTGQSYTAYMKNLPFPVTSDTRVAVYDATAAAIDADGALTVGQKNALKLEADLNIDYFFDNFTVGTDWDGTQVVNAIGPFFQEFGSRNPASPGSGAGIEAWRVANGVAASQIFVTEIGVHRDYDKEGANLADAVAWFTYATAYLDVQGLARAVWDDGDTYFSLRGNGGVVGSITDATAFNADLLNALGMWKVSDAWLPSDEPAGTFTQWINPADRATVTVSGGLISQITDKSGSGNHLTQATGSLQPNDATTGYTTDATRFFETALPANNDNQAIFAVVVPSTVSGTHTLFGPASASGKRQFRTNGTSLEVLRGGVANVAAANVGLTAGAAQLVEMQLSFSAQTVLGRNGTLNTAAGTHSTTFGAASASRIGTKDDGGEDGLATFREHLVCTAKPNARLATQIRYYLSRAGGPLFV